MLSFRILVTGAVVSGLSVIAQTNSPVINNAPNTGVSPQVGVRTNAINLTATNFVAGGLSVTNGALAGYATNYVPPTSILGSNIVVRPISLPEAIAMALQNNFDVQIARFDPAIAGFNLAGSYAIYEPSLGFQYSHSYSLPPGRIDPVTRVVQPGGESESDNFRGAPLLSGYAPSGLTYDIDFSLVGSEFNDPDNINPLLRNTEQYTSGAGISLRQPLLRNFWIDQPRATIQINKKRVKISEWQLRGQMMTTIAAVENAYFDLIRARENIKVQRAALEYNNQLLRENRKRVEVGALAPLDEKQAEAEVARGVATLLQTEQGYALALNTLKNLIVNDFSRWAPIVIDPLETLVAVPTTPQLAESWRRGLEMRPEIQQLKLDLEAQDINLKFLRNQLWPQLDLFGSYGRSGRNTSYGRAADELTEDLYPEHSYGVVFSIPLGNRSARNSLKAAKASTEQSLLSYKALEQDIMVQIDNAIKLLASQYQQVEATRQARLFAQDALLAEQKKFENGKSTSFNVLLYQRDLTRSRFEELAALADYNKALSGLSAAEGGTLVRHNLNVQAQ
ncbi:MAG TPA: TolC family protein [Verrucomicrobiae bacterium]